MELSGRENASKGDRGPVTIFLIQGKEQDWKYFYPELFTIGPYNWFHNHKIVKKTDKKWFVDNLLSDLSPEDKNDVHERCIQQMRRREQEARSCYEKAEQLNSDAFVEMLKLDGCFILSIILVFDGKILADGEFRGKSILLHILKANMDQVKLDLLKLRNQIPFFVLGDLVDILKIRVPKMKNFDLVDSALRLFQGVFSQRTDVGSPRADDIYHLLHLYHSVLVPTPGYKMTNTCCWELSALSSKKSPSFWFPGAMELEKSNIRCTKKEETTISFLDISFRDGMLEIPFIRIEELTRPLLFNLIVLEKSCNLSTQHISAYITFMRNMVRSEGDANLLCSEGIIASAGEVAGFFDKSSRYVGRNCASNYLQPVIKEVNNHHRRRRWRWLAQLKHNHCNNPWVIVSLVAGFVLLVSTVLQTFYTIKGYYKQ